MMAYSDGQCETYTADVKSGRIAEQPFTYKIYKTGETGPGGGIVFCDKGRYTDGWRYLEAASLEADTAGWSLAVADVSTGTALGTGKQNTQAILNSLEEAGETGAAAQLCAQLNQGGYNDWFLPSKDELDFLYGIFKANGLGGLKSDWYWSSSQFSASSAWIQHFSNGEQEFSLKNGTNRVRPIRAF
jgi:hypothetical protein